MVKKLINIEPLVMVTEVVQGEKVTITFNTPGYVYFQAVNIDKDVYELPIERRV